MKSMSLILFIMSISFLSIQFAKWWSPDYQYYVDHPYGWLIIVGWLLGLSLIILIVESFLDKYYSNKKRGVDLK